MNCMCIFVLADAAIAMRHADDYTHTQLLLPREILFISTCLNTIRCFLWKIFAGEMCPWPDAGYAEPLDQLSALMSYVQ